ncbi:hypothetical protein F5Y13DRAFT_155325 [Neofusicoccum parvum]|nr:hypothetical protein F5Y13DRAFT_155325 [Neofusicoccum parvum]
MVGVPKSFRCQGCKRRKCDEDWPTCGPCRRGGDTCSGPPRSLIKFVAGLSPTDEAPAHDVRRGSGPLVVARSSDARVLHRLKTAQRLPKQVPGSEEALLTTELVSTLSEGNGTGYDLRFVGENIHNYYPQMLAGSAALRDAVECLLSAYKAVRRKTSGGEMKPGDELIDPRAYGKALRSLNRACQDPKQQYAVETFAATQIMEWSGANFGILGSTDFGITHSLGAYAWMLYWTYLTRSVRHIREGVPGGPSASELFAQAVTVAEELQDIDVSYISVLKQHNQIREVEIEDSLFPFSKAYHFPSQDIAKIFVWHAMFSIHTNRVIEQLVGFLGGTPDAAFKDSDKEWSRRIWLSYDYARKGKPLRGIYFFCPHSPLMASFESGNEEERAAVINAFWDMLDYRMPVEYSKSLYDSFLHSFTLGGTGRPPASIMQCAFATIDDCETVADDSAAEHGATPLEVDYSNVPVLAEVLAAHNIGTVISALNMDSQNASDAQISLIQAASASGSVTRFIPSDFNVDYDVSDE